MKEIGLILQKARKDKAITIEKVFHDTRIPRKYVEAMESGDTSEFPAEVYYTGSLRRYCQYLGLNPAELMEKYQNQKSAVKAEELRVSKKAAQTNIDVRTIAIIIGVFVLLGAGYLGVQLYNSESGKMKVEEKKIETPAASAQKEEKIEPLKLQVQCLSSTWVRITGDETGLFEGMLEQGKTYDWESKAQFTIRVGYTPGIKVKLDGVVIDMSKGSKQEVNEVVLNRETLKSAK